jgi:hypothetical protein
VDEIELKLILQTCKVLNFLHQRDESWKGSLSISYIAKRQGTRLNRLNRVGSCQFITSKSGTSESETGPCANGRNLTKACFLKENIPDLIKKIVDLVPEQGTIDGTLRPDLTTFFRVAKTGRRVGKVQLSDVKCYWPSADAIVRVHEKSVTKYQPIANRYKSKYGKSKVITIKLPTAGPVQMATFKALKDVGFKAKKVATILRNMMV